jgi:hypothetical protein
MSKGSTHIHVTNLQSVSTVNAQSDDMIRKATTISHMPAHSSRATISVVMQPTYHMPYACTQFAKSSAQNNNKRARDISMKRNTTNMPYSCKTFSSTNTNNTEPDDMSKEGQRPITHTHTHTHIYVHTYIHNTLHMLTLSSQAQASTTRSPKTYSRTRKAARWHSERSSRLLYPYSRRQYLLPLSSNPVLLPEAPEKRRGEL